MKKALISLAWIFAAFIFFGSFASAELYIYNLFDGNGAASNDTYVKILNEYDSSRWYLSSITATCDVANNNVVISSPIVTDWDLYDVPVYRLFLSPYRISQLKNWNDNIDVSKIIIKEYSKTADSQNISFNISTADWLDSNQVYYAFLLPINEYDEIWTPSNEFCFQLTNNMCVWDEACDSIGLLVQPTELSDNTEDINNTQIGDSWEVVNEIWEEWHGSACVWMDLANVTHVVNENNTITLKWTSLWDWSTVRVAIFDPDEEIYKSLWSANMDDEKFSYKMQWNGEQNFSLTNWCKEIYYKVDASIKTPEPEIKSTPATGPAENVLYIAIAAIVLYGAYVLFFRKSENK